MLIVASTAAVLIPALFGVIGTIIGAWISRAVAVSQHRADKDANVRLAGAKCLSALDELGAENSTRNVRSARAKLMELGHAAISAGLDTRLARGAIRYGSDNILRYADPDVRKAMRADPLRLATECAAALIVAVDTIPYRRRRGPFMDPDLQQKADKYNALYEMLARIPERPYTGPIWQLARFQAWLRGFKRSIKDLFARNPRRRD